MTLPSVKGIKLVPTRELPDSVRAIFPYPAFNAVQSKCFDTVYRTDDNLVLAAPTSSGKTAVLELAICRLATSAPDRRFKVIYQAPTKALCAERQRDWQTKFACVNLKCAELTGDTDVSQQRHVQDADIIITTPEKWDSITRKWRDHDRLIQLVRLFLIDEIQILNEDRGATLEAVISRMKVAARRNASDIRLISLSASIPNAHDIATWLGRNRDNQHMPAICEAFGEEFRPVRLQKYVVGIHATGNDYSFDKSCNHKLPEIISKYSLSKPIMIFCFTRKSTETTALELVHWWQKCSAAERYWNTPRSTPKLEASQLNDCVPTGVAYHHGGLSIHDRSTIEKAYLKGEIGVICCTSTLAVGVNLPCHLVVVKNTVSWQDRGCKEYSDLEIMQMLGRAGRPQFDDSAVAVIMTRQEKVQRYEKMVAGTDVLESRLHLNLIDHLNAEIGLGTVKDLRSANEWLAGTFLAVRIKANPKHYYLERESASGTTTLKLICQRDIGLLQDFDLVSKGGLIRSTEFGEAMARYCVQFETMKTLLGLEKRSRMSEILSALAQAGEFKTVRMRAAERHLYKDINDSPYVRFPIPAEVVHGAHKVSLIIQAVLGGIDLRGDDRYKKQLPQFTLDKDIIFLHIHRLVRCVIDCQLHLCDSIAARNAMKIARSLGAGAWDDSPLQLLQIDMVGPVASAKFIAAGIRSIEELEATDPHKINMIMSRNPPFGHQIHENIATFPKLRVSLSVTGYEMITDGESKIANVRVKAEIGFLNNVPPVSFKRKPVYVCFLAETSDGKKVHFFKASAKELCHWREVTFAAILISSNQLITCYLSCDDIAGTEKQATVNPDIQPLEFHLVPSTGLPESRSIACIRKAKEKQQTERPDTPTRGLQSQESARLGTAQSSTFDDSDLDDADLREAVADDEYDDIDEISSLSATQIVAEAAKPRTTSMPQFVQQAPMSTISRTAGSRAQKKLPNGNYECLHSCIDKLTCRHLCCRDGVLKPRIKQNLKQQKAPSPVKGSVVQQIVTGRHSSSAALTDGQSTLTIPKLNMPVSRSIAMQSLSNRLKPSLKQHRLATLQATHHLQGPQASDWTQTVDLSATDEPGSSSSETCIVGDKDDREQFSICKLDDFDWLDKQESEKEQQESSGLGSGLQRKRRHDEFLGECELASQESSLDHHKVVSFQDDIVDLEAITNNDQIAGVAEKCEVLQTTTAAEKHLFESLIVDPDDEYVDWAEFA